MDCPLLGGGLELILLPRWVPSPHVTLRPITAKTEGIHEPLSAPVGLCLETRPILFQMTVCRVSGQKGQASVRVSLPRLLLSSHKERLQQVVPQQVANLGPPARTLEILRHVRLAVSAPPLGRPQTPAALSLVPLGPEVYRTKGVRATPLRRAKLTLLQAGRGQQLALLPGKNTRPVEQAEQEEGEEVSKLLGEEDLLRRRNLAGRLEPLGRVAV